MTASPHPLWPLFDLRIRSERLVLRLPTEVELVELAALARAGIHPPDEMPFGVAWSTLPSPAFERGFIQYHWRTRAEWTPDAWTLDLLVDYDGQPIGVQGIGAQRFPVLRTVSTGSWLGRAFQGRGLGREMRGAILGFAFDGLGAEVADTEAFTDNAASNAISRGLGYQPNGIGRLAPDGVARDTVRYRMTRAQWGSQPRPPVAIDGLERCGDLFGLG
ncbi:MAG TPA: GNAT family protein [Clostridia bacterium]|nr:GNAT family protein [Clostridia bacterium]